ncbi:TIM44-like domain-containing protein [Enterovirga sp.]|uniref:Tim44 domain-containing protein n=1 Tax=Enterovirga sp. TaxID=2026350 RepID=UPI002CDD0424|nr:TIM44-like domain-containing protein [Enterovirga sp.]HMO30906.1 TIM44-like domain-containing protein [Enterovirga sp.]
MIRRFGTFARTALVAGLVTVLAAPVVEARPGGGRSMGSRGGSTFSAPPPTATAPRPAQPIQRSETPGIGQPRPGMATAAPAQPRRFGFGTGLAAGLLGAGLFGLLTGHGFLGGIAGLASFIGLLLQIGLIAGLVWFALRFFRRRSEPAMAAGPGLHGRSPLGGAAPGGFSARGFGGGGPARQPIQIAPEDYRAFERCLGDLQVSYGRGDLGALRRLATPEMARYLEEDLAEDRRRGIRNEITDAKLLQGDLAEAWREGTTEYATVAMRYEIVEAYVEVASGRVVQGNRTAPTEVTEIWTFRRDMKGPWLLSAIQQTE